MPVGTARSAAREVQDLTSGWRFLRIGWTDREGGEPNREGSVRQAVARRPDDDPTPHLPPGEAEYRNPDHDDSGWRSLDIPHDWGVEGPFRDSYPRSTGKLPYWGVGWYRKGISIPVEDVGRRIFLDFDGAMSFSAVWVNGTYVGGWPYGYTSFRLDLTDHLRYGEVNLIAVRLDNPPESSRWYPGGGLNRKVRLVKTGAVHVDDHGVFISTPHVDQQSARVQVDVDVVNTSNRPGLRVRTRIFAIGVGGEPVAQVETAVPVDQGTPARRVRQVTSMDSPALWSPEHPYLHVAVTEILDGEEILDRYETVFGVRSVTVDADAGLTVNGIPHRLHGVCLHDDLGALGNIASGAAIGRRLCLLKAMGCNAIRTVHNPPAPELLDLCDRLGFLVILEFFDAWRIAKKGNDYAHLFDRWHRRDMSATIRRDRNHPSVIMWSTGNEVRDQRDPNGPATSRLLTSIVHGLDPTRPVTVGCHFVESGYNGFESTVDVFGFNYKPVEYGRFHATHPGLPLVGSETTSCVSSRGEYFFPVTQALSDCTVDFQVSSYDHSSPAWGSGMPDNEFTAQDSNPFILGEFVWSGFDYLGEPTPFNRDDAELLNFASPEERAVAEAEQLRSGAAVPSRSSYFGIIDTAGLPKDRYFLYRSRWRPDVPGAHILPHWNWPEREGLVTPVNVYTSGDAGELYLNGRSMGYRTRAPGERWLKWDEIVYHEGELRVVTYRDGRYWAEDVVRTTGRPVALVATVERAHVNADDDLVFVTVSAVDRDELVVPRAQNDIEYSIDGSGAIVAIDNGDPTSAVPFSAGCMPLFNGFAVVTVRPERGGAGLLTLRARSDGLADATATVPVQRS